MFEIKTYDHDGYNRVNHEPIDDILEAMEIAVNLASMGDNRYSREVTIFLEGKRFITVHQDAAQKFLAAIA